MRQLFFAAALLSMLTLGRAAESTPLKTNPVSVGPHGNLEITAPDGWQLLHTNLNLPGKPVSVELHAPGNTVEIRLNICWDGFPGPITNPTDADMALMVSNVVAAQYLPMSVEKKIDLEKLRGPGVTGFFVRLTDASWTPVLKDQYRNQGVGMFRAGNLWGDFDLLCNDKDGSQFNAGLKVMQSLRRKP
ncbi:MAG TPA: hypothetical protein VN873_09225 [Candidatus Angelobacter sp.]|nr:hypothetical protein [Candidatus Angelobacter sp.]